MSKKANTTLIGGFVVGAIVLAVVGIMLFGSGKFMSKRVKFVLFFNESVKGLNVGAPVDFKGVNVGSVTDVRLLLDVKDTSLSIPVYIEIDPEKVSVAKRDEESFKKAPKKGAVMAKFIEEGMRGQLVTQSLVTGLLGIHLDFFPDKPAKYVGDGLKTPEIPTTGSSLSELAKTVENLPVEQIADKLLKTLAGIEKLVNSPVMSDALENIDLTAKGTSTLVQSLTGQVQPISSSVQTTLADAQKVMREFGNSVKPLVANVDKTAKDASTLMKDINERVPLLITRMDEALKSATLAMQQADKAMVGLAGQNSAVRYELVNALTEFSTAARSFRVMADYLERNPEALIRGKAK